MKYWIQWGMECGEMKHIYEQYNLNNPHPNEFDTFSNTKYIEDQNVKKVIEWLEYQLLNKRLHRDKDGCLYDIFKIYRNFKTIENISSNIYFDILTKKISYEELENIFNSKINDLNAIQKLHFRCYMKMRLNSRYNTYLFAKPLLIESYIYNFMEKKIKNPLLSYSLYANVYEEKHQAKYTNIINPSTFVSELENLITKMEHSNYSCIRERIEKIQSLNQ